MGMKLKKMSEAITTVTVEWYGEEAEVVVMPGKLTRQALDDLEKDEEDAINQQVMLVVKSWDILGDDGKPLPVDEATIKQLPFGFIRALLSAAIETIQEQGRG